MSTLRLAFGLLTILPVGVVSDPDRRTIRRAVLLAPLVGLVVGIVAALALFLARVGLDTSFTGMATSSSMAALVAAGVGILALEALSGGLHMDGLADSVDGLAARGDKDRTLTVMRDPSVGAMGALAIAATLIVGVTALGLAVHRGHGTEALITAAVTGRVAIVWGCTRRAATAEGLGAWVARSVREWEAIAVTVLALLVPVVLSRVDDDASRVATLFAVAAVPAGLLFAAIGTRAIRGRLGGVTGDVLGAGCQWATTGALLMIACAP